jgi:pilus assembly protein Flp/PilA
MMKFIKDFWRSLNAATAIEYGLIAAGIALAIAAVVFGLGDVLFDLLWEDIPNAFNG